MKLYELFFNHMSYTFFRYQYDFMTISVSRIIITIDYRASFQYKDGLYMSDIIITKARLVRQSYR